VLRGPLILFLSALVLVLNAHGQNEPDRERKIELPIATWLAAGEHQDFKGKLKIQPPFLTYQQRHRVRVISTYDLRALQRSGVQRDLHFVLKVADEGNRWASGESYVETQIDALVSKDSDLEIETEVNVLPGRYRFAAIMYDSVHQQRSVRFADVKVDPVKDDPLPGADAALPKIEFLPKADRNVSQFGIGKLHLPVENKRPLAIDLLFDVSAPTFRGSARLGSLVASRQVQVANVIADLRLRSGCMRLTGTDLLRQEVLFERKDAQTIDWFQVRAEILRRNLSTISVDKLSASDEVAPFLQSELEKLLAAPPPGCAAASKRVIIVLTSGVMFPPGTKNARVSRNSDCDCEIFYLRVARILPFDDVPGVLKELSPRRIEADDPRDFRKELHHLITHLEQL
jgi:hypothetical protein